MVSTWKQVRDHPNYQVNTDGYVLNATTQRVLKDWRVSSGYRVVGLGRGVRFYVHRLVTEAFLGKGLGLDVNHKNGDKSDNRLENLEYCTRSANQYHAALIGLKPRGEDSHLSKLDNEAARHIIETKGQTTHEEMARMYNVKSATVRAIRAGRRWRWLNKEVIG